MRGISGRSANINVMFHAIEKALYGLKRDFGEIENLQVSLNGPNNFIANTYKRSEHRIYKELERSRRGYGFIFANSTKIHHDSEYCWIVNSLDGKKNFLHGIPHFAISIALQKNKETIAAIIYDVPKNEFFWAEKGIGAYFDNRRLRVSARRRLNDCILASSISQNYIPSIEIRQMGVTSLDLAYVAAGKYDGYWNYDLKIWDIAAGMLMITEAGGYICDHDGNKDKDILNHGNIIATNDHIHSILSQKLKNFIKSKS